MLIAKPQFFHEHIGMQAHNERIEATLSGIIVKAVSRVTDASAYIEEIRAIVGEGLACAIVLTKSMGTMGLIVLPILGKFTIFLYTSPLHQSFVGVLGDVRWSRGLQFNMVTLPSSADAVGALVEHRVPTHDKTVALHHTATEAKVHLIPAILKLGLGARSEKNAAILRIMPLWGESAAGPSR